jgi:hypothetical protein
MELNLELPEDINEIPLEVELTKPRKKKVYTKPKTDKQMQNFDKAKQIRLERINQKKQEDQEKLIKQILDNEKKIKKSTKPEVKITEYNEDKSSSDGSDEEIIIKSKPKTKKPKKSKKKTIVYMSDSESEESEPEPVPIQKPRIQRKTVQPIEPKPINNNQIEYKNYFI